MSLQLHLLKDLLGLFDLTAPDATVNKRVEGDVVRSDRILILK